jgi:hypothetical protein
MHIIPPAIGFAVFVTTVIIGRIVQERALRTLSTEAKGRLVEAFAGLRLFALLPLAAIAALYFAMSSLDALTTQVMLAIYLPLVVVFTLVMQWLSHRKLQAMDLDPGYLRAYAIGRGVTLVGFGTLLLSL